MNILFICHRLPFPPDRGGKIRPFYFIKHLSQTHQVTVASLAETQEEIEKGAELGNYCREVIVEKIAVPVRWGKALLGMLTPRPSSLRYFHSAKLIREIGARAHRLPFDLTLVHCAFVAQYASALKSTPLIMDFGDLDSGKLFEYQRYRSFPLSWAYGYEARKLRAYESHLSKQATMCTFTTPYEMEEFQSFNSETPRAVIPNGVNVNYFEYLEDSKVKPESLVFVGRLDYFPNEQGILWFVHQVLPRVRRMIPQASLTIVGSNPGVQVRRLDELPGVLVTGHVPDVRPFLREAALAIAPLQIARGVQNKILEAMAIGTPVVATTEAARGIHTSDRQCFLVGRDAEEFAHHVVQVLQKPQLREVLSENGRRHIHQHYTWRRSMELLDEILPDIS